MKVPNFRMGGEQMMKLINDIKRLLCKHSWKELPRFIALNTGKISPKRKCIKCGKVEETDENE